jgi:TatD DNase family protein
MAIFYDTHAHLDYKDFTSDISEVVKRAEQAGISKIISIGTDQESSERALSLAQKFSNVFAVVGWHPSDAGAAPDDFRPILRKLASQPKVVALGETGLDYHRLPSTQSGGSGAGADDEAYKRKQAELFGQHLEVASELGLNCVIHQRDCFEETLTQFQPFAAGVRGVFHCFANDAAAMQRIIGMGSMVSFTGIVTFKNGQNIRDTLAATPMGGFMLETDSPFLAPVPYRGKRCEPAYVKEISETAAQVKSCSLEELSEATCEAAHRFFKGLA